MSPPSATCGSMGAQQAFSPGFVVPLERARPATLHDGTPLLFRPIRPQDKARLLDAFLSLSPTARYRRFLAPISWLSDQQLRYFTEIDFVDHVAWVAEPAGERGRPLAGVGRWVRSPSDPEQAEIALAVVDAYQGRGLGSALLGLLAQSAWRRGVRRFEARVLAENGPMCRVLRAFGAVTGQFDGGTYTFDLPVATAARYQPTQPGAARPVGDTAACKTRSGPA